MSQSSNASSGGIGVFGLLGVAFVVLKLTHVIDWSWWWVTAPFWGGLAVILAVMLVLAVVWLFASAAEWWSNRRKPKRHALRPHR